MSSNILLIEIKRKLKKQKEAKEIQTALYMLSEAVNKSRDVDELYKAIHKILGMVLCADNFYIALFDIERSKLKFPYFVDRLDKKPDDRIFGKGLTELVIRSKKALLADAGIIERLKASGEIETSETNSLNWLGVPLTSGDDVIGAMVIQNYSDEISLGKKELDIMSYISEPAAMAIEKKILEEKNAEYVSELEKNKTVIEKKTLEINLLNKKLTESERHLKELNANKDKYFSILSHDLKSPFNSLIGFTGILTEDFDTLTKDEIKKYVGFITASTNNLYNLIENLLHWSKLQRNIYEFIPCQLNLKARLTEVYDLLSGIAQRKNISINIMIDEKLTVKADPDMLHSILQNLITNAIKFTMQGGSVTVSAAKINTAVEISIKDSGVGIKESDIEKLFKIGKSFSTKGTNNEQGSGLGLILVKEMVEKHGGSIRVESELNKGTNFYLLLPY